MKKGTISALLFFTLFTLQAQKAVQAIFTPKVTDGK